MSFDWSQKKVEKYRKRAEKEVKKAGYGLILKVDEKQFGIAPGVVKVYFKPIDKRGHKRIFQAMQKALPGLTDRDISYQHYGIRRKNRIYIHPCMELPRDKCDL